MFKGERAFTIVEVLIALAVSGALFTAGIAVFSQQKQDTQFDQAVYDLQSQFNSYVNQVSNKVLPGIQQYKCAKSGTTGLAYLSYVGGTGNTTGEVCIYLGQAIQIVPGGTTIYSYPVFGFRTYLDSNGNVQFPQNPSQANPEPGLDGSTPQKYQLVTTYAMFNALKVDSTYGARLSGNANQQDLLTFYSSLQNNNTSGNELLAASYQTTYSTSDTRALNVPSPSPDPLKNCIENPATGCSPATPLNNKTWKLCVTDGRRSATLNVSGTATGISTRIIMGACS